MSAPDKAIRQTVSLPPRVARQVRALARRNRASTNRVLVELIEAGLDAREQERKRFFELADRLVESTDPAEQARLKKDLAQMTFGD
jgi:hypothetical protein